MIEWVSPQGTVFTMCQLVDFEKANCNEENAALWQRIIYGQQSAALPGRLLEDARKYVVACTHVSSQFRVLDFSKTTFTSNGVEEPPIVESLPLFINSIMD